MNTNTETKAGELTGSRHTPGPWRVERDFPYHDIMFGNVLIASTFPIKPCASVAEFATDKQDEEQAIGAANARLIASAPELYEALSEALAFLGGVSRFTDERLVREMARNALLKAEGKV